MPTSARTHAGRPKVHRFVVHEHHASRLHFDFRLEMDGVLKSWAVPKGPSLNPSEKRLAVEVEDHPLGYIDFEGTIAEGNYGAGEVAIWDSGTYVPQDGADLEGQLQRGRFVLHLQGHKLHGLFTLVRLARGEGQWLLVKGQDEYADREWRLETVLPAPPAKARARRTREAGHGKVKASSTAREDSSPPNKKPEGADGPLPVHALEQKGLSGNLSIDAPGGIVELSSLDKVLWPDSGHTKGDLVRYYHLVSDFILPYLEQRPLILKRFPNGIAKPSFFQHEAGEVPGFVDTARLESEEGRPINYILCENEATLLYVSNLGAIERHPWNARIDSLDRPDWMVFDLDPGDDVAFGQICELAASVRDVLERLGLKSYPKTSGSRGIHVYVPIESRYSFEQIAPLAARIAERVVDANPSIATLERALEDRGSGQIYVDHLQNAKGKSVVSPYSVRPRPGATVSTPLSWQEVESCVDPGSFTIDTIPGRIRKLGELFKPVLEAKQDLGQALKLMKAS